MLTSRRDRPIVKNVLLTVQPTKEKSNLFFYFVVVLLDLYLLRSIRGVRLRSTYSHRPVVDTFTGLLGSRPSGWTSALENYRF